MALENPFDVLGVSEAASDDEIRVAWRRKIQQVHPDVAGEGFTDERRACGHPDIGLSYR